MKLSDWLAREGLTRRDFAKRIGVSPATLTSLCDGGWMLRSTAEAVMRETRGEVTPTDFLIRAGDAPAPEPRSAA